MEENKDNYIITKPSYTLPAVSTPKETTEEERDTANPRPKQFCTWNEDMVGRKGKTCKSFHNSIGLS